MTDCPYCVGGFFLAERLDDIWRVEVRVRPEDIPFLDIKVHRADGNLMMCVGFNIRYCPMCGRRLTDG